MIPLIAHNYDIHFLLIHLDIVFVLLKNILGNIFISQNWKKPDFVKTIIKMIFDILLISPQSNDRIVR